MSNTRTASEAAVLPAWHLQPKQQWQVAVAARASLSGCCQRQQRLGSEGAPPSVLLAVQQALTFGHWHLHLRLPSLAWLLPRFSAVNAREAVVAFTSRAWYRSGCAACRVASLDNSCANASAAAGCCFLPFLCRCWRCGAASVAHAANVHGHL